MRIVSKATVFASLVLLEMGTNASVSTCHVKMQTSKNIVNI